MLDRALLRVILPGFRGIIVKNAYKIFNASGGLLCVQIAHSAVEAVDFAKMYGFNDAFRAEQV